jgi:uncharacterized protein DUF5615
VIALYTDENVDQRIVRALRRRAVDVLTAHEGGLTGSVDDARHLELATAKARALLTADTDLLAIGHDWTTAGRPHAGIIFYHQRWTTVGHVVNQVYRIAQGLEAQDVRNRIVFISWNRRRPTAGGA